MASLPKRLIVIDNPDKLYHESWNGKRDMLDIPHPYRAVLFGPPNSGKSLIIKNLLLRAKPEFEELFVIHPDINFTKEYDDVDATMLDEVPAPDEWEGKNKTLVIIDDMEFKQMNKEQKRNLDRLMGYVSTHKNISVIITAQDAFNVPPSVRRNANLFVLWKTPDMDSMAQVARKAGMKGDELKSLFKNIANKQYDSIWIDLTTNTPYPLRLNGYKVIKRYDTGKRNKKTIEEFKEV